MAGAFDSMGYAREAFVEQIYDNSFTDILVKYGQIIQNDRNSLNTSLFGDFEPIETPKPEFPMVAPWNRLRLLEEEKKLVTVYLSAHPLDPYYMEVNYGCSCKCGEFDEIKEAGNTYTLGGIVTSVDSGTSQKGAPWLGFTLEDFSGNYTFKVWGKEVANLKNRVQPNDFIRVKTRVNASFYRPGSLDVKIEDIQFLQDISSSTANGVRIYLDRNFAQPDFYSRLMNFDAKERPGDLYMKIFDRERNQLINIHSRKKFPITKELIQFLDDWGIKYEVINN